MTAPADTGTGTSLDWVKFTNEDHEEPCSARDPYPCKLVATWVVKFRFPCGISKKPSCELHKDQLALRKSACLYCGGIGEVLSVTRKGRT